MLVSLAARRTENRDAFDQGHEPRGVAEQARVDPAAEPLGQRVDVRHDHIDRRLQLEVSLHRDQRRIGRRRRSLELGTREGLQRLFLLVRVVGNLKGGDARAELLALQLRDTGRDQTRRPFLHDLLHRHLARLGILDGDRVDRVAALQERADHRGRGVLLVTFRDAWQRVGLGVDDELVLEADRVVDQDPLRGCVIGDDHLVRQQAADHGQEPGLAGAGRSDELPVSGRLFGVLG